MTQEEFKDPQPGDKIILDINSPEFLEMYLSTQRAWKKHFQGKVFQIEGKSSQSDQWTSFTHNGERYHELTKHIKRFFRKIQ